jgi:hypothetical protein
MEAPLCRLRRLPPRGTPPVAWRSQFHGGSGMGGSLGAESLHALQL